MKTDFKFSNLCGTVYRKGNLVFTPDGNSIISPVGNRVTVFDLVNNKTETLPFENKRDIRRLALSPNGNLLLSVDELGQVLLVNYRKRTVLHYFNLKDKVRDIQFSPDGRYFAVGLGRTVEVWRSPGYTREFAPFELHRKYAGHYDDITHISWAPDSRFFLTSGKDMVARIFSVDPIEGFKPTTLAGHRHAVVGAWFAKDMSAVYTVSADGAICVRRFRPYGVEENLTFGEFPRDDEGNLVRTVWFTESRHYAMQTARVQSAAFSWATGLMVLGFTNGVFGIWEMPEFNMIHSLSISRKKINTIAINPSGEWLAFGSSKLGQLLVWEWQSETYVLKQQGHFYDMSCVAYSGDGQYVATGGDDAKLKVWNALTGYCFITFTEHTSAVTAVHFSKGSQVVLSASLDGTVRAYDLVRYRNFRIFTSPTPVQFTSLAVDPSGEIVCAGCQDTFEIYMWSMQTGKLLDVLSGHEGPISALAFRPDGLSLASSSWDKSVRLWDAFDRSKIVERLDHNNEVLTLAYRPDGKELCASTLDGQIHFWDVLKATATGTIEGRRDIAGGRKANDRQTAANSSSGKCFNSLCYSADGTAVLGGGNSKFVCLYDRRSSILLRKFQVSKNQSLDGVQDKLNSRLMTEAGPADLIDSDGIDSDTEKQVDRSLPGVKSGDKSNRVLKPEVRTRDVKFAPTGRQWAAASTEGLLIYSLDETLIFDPFELDEDVTPDSIRALARTGDYLRALVNAFRLNEQVVIRQVYESIPPLDVALLTKDFPEAYLERLLKFIASIMESSQLLEYHLRWVSGLLSNHGTFVKTRSVALQPVLRMLQRSILRMHQDIGSVCDKNYYSLGYLLAQGKRAAEEAEAGENAGDITMNDVFASFNDGDEQEDAMELDATEVPVST
ncbi:U3 snoRNP protein [Coemansia sp. RSA 2711]|nr:U3 snoRNP protein [Coemansia sp. RSA 2711]KAJ2313406.1 U3 snoRNP protein [Coemansia sp. RSA 2705]KAJ2319980.1 U3 snoRNP protein [Coemansia sp. RSA 2704]KAJ2390565.1 U3 snoRNP protein [Coemansia sp. RSA 2611]KAJ2737885.1 U3 snoRNP protein [Coemansia sp. Cherry 401B]